MERDPKVFVYGIGANDHAAIFGSTKGLPEFFGNSRCRDTPIAEDTMTGVGIGAKISRDAPCARSYTCRFFNFGNESNCKYGLNFGLHV